MPEYIEIRRVTVIADVMLEKIFIEEFLKLGAKGFNCTHCFGKGRHAVVEDPFTGRFLVRIEVLSRPEVADAIMKYVHQEKFAHHPVLATIETVSVLKGDAFF